MPDGGQGPEAGGTPSAPDTKITETTRHTPEQVVTAFNSTYELFVNASDSELTPELQAARDFAKSFKERAKDEGRGFFIINRLKTNDGRRYQQKEYFPIDGLISFLDHKIQDGGLSEEEKKIYEDRRSVLSDSKYIKTYEQFRTRLSPQGKIAARIQQEYERISNDSRLTTGDRIKDYILASEILLQRRELVLPKEKTTPPVPPPEPPRISDYYEVIIGGQNEDIRKLVARCAQIRIEERTTEGFPTHLPQNRVLRVGRLIAHSLNPRNYGRILFHNMKEYYRQTWMNEHYQNLRDTNFGATNRLSQTAAQRALEEVQQIRASGKAVVERMKKEEGVFAGEVGPTEAQGEFREYVIGQILRPTIEELEPFLKDEIANQGQIDQLENDIQRRFFEYVSTHQNDAQIIEFFGRNATHYGDLSEFYASDMMETARKIISDGKAQEFALGQLDNITKVRVFRASWAEQGEIRRSLADRMLAAAERRRLTGTLITPATIGITASAITFLSMRALGMGVKATHIATPAAGAISGAIFGGLRRNWDLKEYYKEVNRELEAGDTTATPGRTPQREQVERFVLPLMTRQQELIEGGGIELLTGVDREGIQQLIERGNIEALTRRYGEIRARLDFPHLTRNVRRFIFFGTREVPEGVGLVRYESRSEIGQNKLELVEELIETRQFLLKSGMTEDDFDNSIAHWTERLIQERQTQEAAFARYRLKESLEAAAVAGAIGLTGGLVSQEILAEVARNLPESSNIPVIGAMFRKGQTLAEKGIGAISGHPEIGIDLDRSSTANIEIFKDLHDTATLQTVQINEGFEATVSPKLNNPDPSVSFKINGEEINGITATLDETGHFDIEGKIPDTLRTELEESSFEINQEPDKTLPPMENKILSKDTANLPLKIDGHDVVIPQGTEWVHDQADPNKLDLIISGHPDKIIVDDAQFDRLGKLIDWDKSKSLDSSFFEIKNTGAEDQIINGGQAVEKWKELGRNIDHREWYSYDQPESQGNELRLYDAKQGDTVILDMSRMQLGYQQGLNPNQIDVQEVIRNHESGFAFSLPGHEDTPIWVPDGADGAFDGLLHLNPNDTTHFFDLPDGTKISIADFTKMVVNQEALQKFPDGDLATEVYHRENIFRLGLDGKWGFIEAGRINEQGALQAFATIRGASEAQIVIPGKFTVEIDLLKDIAETKEVPPIQRYEVIPPLPLPPEEAPPIIPIPFAPRFPLESLLMLYGYGSYSGEGLGWVNRNEYEGRRSRRLNENPYARLDESVEAEDYLSRMDQQYRQELEQMDQRIGTTMDGETRAVVTIPVFGEGKIIRRTLEQFLNQKDENGNPINPNLFEIIVFENDTESRPKDETEEEIRKFNRDHPELRVYYAYRRWTQEDIDNRVNTVGNGRRYNCDLALLRSSKRTSRFGELIIINNDADLEGISPKYIRGAIAQFDSKDYLDTIVGKRTLPDWTLKKPNIRAGQRLWEIFDSIMRHTGGGGEMSPDKREKGWPGMIGENSAMRASVYAAVGGYGPQARLAEDQNLGDMMRVARNYDDRRFEYANRLETIKNPRRYLTYMVGGKALIEMYNDYHENKDIRTLDNNQLLSRIPDEFDIKRFELDADGIYQKKDYYRHLGDDGFDKRFRRLMDFMGAEYIIEDGHVKITNADRLIERLNRLKLSPSFLGRTSSGRRAPSRSTVVSASTPRTSTIGAPPSTTNKSAAEVEVSVDSEQVRTTTTGPLPDQISEKLRSSTAAETRFEASPEEVISFLKTIDLPFGSKIVQSNGRIAGGKLEAAGDIKSKAGMVHFVTHLTNDPSGNGLKVDYHDIKLPFLAKAARDVIESKIQNLNQVIASQINSQIDPAWEIANLRIQDNNLVFDFKKK